MLAHCAMITSRAGGVQCSSAVVTCRCAHSAHGPESGGPRRLMRAGRPRRRCAGWTPALPPPSGGADAPRRASRAGSPRRPARCARGTLLRRLGCAPLTRLAASGVAAAPPRPAPSMPSALPGAPGRPKPCPALYARGMVRTRVPRATRTGRGASPPDGDRALGRARRHDAAPRQGACRLCRRPPSAPPRPRAWGARGARAGRHAPPAPPAPRPDGGGPWPPRRCAAAPPSRPPRRCAGATGARTRAHDLI